MKEINFDSARKSGNSQLFARLQLLESDFFLASMIFVAVLASRLPFRSQILYHWDSVNFAYAMQNFNIAKEQPQPPGYILYVGLTRFINLIFHDPQSTMVILSIIASALAAVAIFYLGKVIFSREVGIIAALFLASSLLFWFYGEIALPHTLDMLLVIVSAWWLYEVMQGNYRFFLPAIALLAIAGGVRQQTLVFLAPLVLFSLRHVGWRRFIFAGFFGGVICLAWFVPLTYLSGGVSNYFRVMGEFSQRFQATTSIFMGAGWFGLKRNISKLFLYTVYGWGVALFPVALYFIYRIWKREWPAKWEKINFLLLWIVPASGYYALIHMGQQGLVFVFLPALFLISAVSLNRVFSRRRTWQFVFVTAVLVFNTAFFYYVPEYPLGLNSERMLTRATIVNSDNYFQERFKAIQNDFDPRSTVILAENWHYVEYYLPGYPVLHFDIGAKREINAGLPANEIKPTYFTPGDLNLDPGPDGQVTLIIFDPELDQFNLSPGLMKKKALSGGDKLEYVDFGKDKPFYMDSHSFGVIPR